MDLGPIFQGHYLAIKRVAGYCLFIECEQWLELAMSNLPVPTSPQLCFALFVADFSHTYYTAYVLRARVVAAKKWVF